MKKLLFLVLVILVGTEGWGQELKCGDSFIRQELTPQRIADLIRQDSIDKTKLGIRSLGNTPKIIPVVVHVLAKSSTTIGISYEQVKKGIENINTAFAAQGHYSQGLNTNISLCLVYVDLAITGNGNFQLNTDNLASIQVGNRNLAWSEQNFLNIYLVDKAYEGATERAGFGNVPDISPSDRVMKFDGIVLVKSRFGIYDIGGIPDYNPPHEVGHYLGLYHTFQNGCLDWDLSFDCNISGDKVCDTPPCSVTFIGGSYKENHPEPYDTCPLDGKDDLEDNFMCYNDNYKKPTKFTQGQIDRMHNIIARYRPNLFLNNQCTDIENRSFEPNNTISEAKRVFPDITQGYISYLTSYLLTSTDR